MKFIRRLLIFIAVILVGGIIFLSFARPNWKNEIAFIPPTRVASYNCDEIEAEVAKYDWDTNIAMAIAQAESSCNAEAKGDTDLVFTQNGREYGYSVGAFQIRILPGREKCDTYDVRTNVKCAYDLYFDAGDFTDWSMYTNGTYKKYTWRTLNDFMLEFKS